MKSVNVRKIAALTGIAVLGFATVAMADVVFGSTQLVDQNGQPTVKIVVGTQAAVSDGVAAANIAAKIANEAYKSSTLTASVSGTPTCTVGAGVSGAGTCSIVESSKTVTLEVSVPGTVAGTHSFKTLITDTIDRNLQNRNDALSEDVYSATMSATDTSGSVTSPLRAVETGLKGQDLYRIGSAQFSGFADYSVVDDQGAGIGSYTEEQNFWVGSRGNNTVAYDPASAYRDVVVNKYSAMVYNLKFVGNDYGIPVCTGDLQSNISDDWTSCGTDSNSRTDRHRVKIKFMGSEWIISEMNDPAVIITSSTAVNNSGQIKLAKEAKYGIINVGQVLDAGTFKVRLSDISVAVGSDNKHPAIVDVLDANEAVVGQIQVDPGTTYTFTQSGTGNTIKVHVYKTAPGFTLNAKWAEMAIYSDEITLKDGSRYNLVSSTDVDKNFKVSLLWKNRDYTGASGGADTSGDSLREIVIYNIDGFDSKTKAGDVTNFLVAKPTFKTTYNGVDLVDDEYQALTYTAQSADNYRIATGAGDVICNSSSASDFTYTAKLVEIKTAGSNLIGGTGDALSGDYMFEKVLFDPIGRFRYDNHTGQNLTLSQINASVLAGTQQYNTSTNTTNEFNTPVVFWKVSGRDCYNWNQLSYAAPSNFALTTQGMRFDTAGDNSAAQGAIFFASKDTQTLVNSPTNLSLTYPVSILMQEDAGTYRGTSNNEVWTGIPLLSNDTSLSTMRFRTTDSATAYIYYLGLGNTSNFVGNEPVFVSERGSKTTSVGTSDVAFKVAKRIGKPSFTFALADTSAASGGEEYVLKVGDSKVFGGVTVKVKAIDATAGSCSVLGPGGVPACTVDSGSLKAVVQPDNQESVEVSMPYALKSSLVVMDSEAPGAGVVVTVGGPIVNTVTSAALQGSDVNFDTENVVVKEIGNTIVVAGKSAADTMSAADQFIAGVKRQ